MKNVNLNKILSTAFMVSVLYTTTVVAGPGDEPFEVPVNCVRKGPNVETVEKLTYEKGQLTATVNGQTHTAKAKGDVLTGVIERNLFEEYINKGNKISLGYGIDNAFEVEATAGLLGGGRTGKKALARSVINNPLFWPVAGELVNIFLPRPQQEKELAAKLRVASTKISKKSNKTTIYRIPSNNGTINICAEGATCTFIVKKATKRR